MNPSENKGGRTGMNTSVQPTGKWNLWAGYGKSIDVLEEERKQIKEGEKS